MSGNVNELCQDLYDNDYYKNSAQTNPKGPTIGSRYVYRGGNWNCDACDCRSSRRENGPGDLSNVSGLRLCLSE